VTATRALQWAAWWLVLFGVWVALVGTKAWLELVAGACAALIGVVAIEVVTAQGLLSFRFRLRWLREAGQPLARIVPDFVLLTLALVRRRRDAGAFRAVPFDAGGDTPLGAGRRAFVTVAGSLAPNTLVVDVDLERKLLLVHEFDPRAAPEPPSS
jgi:multisubunit Na+/H+ antiporter MnhE subunit